MSADDRFERDLRQTLVELAPEPAPDHLVERVAGIPEDRAAASRPAQRLTPGLALAAAVVLAAVAGVLVTRPAGGPGASQPAVIVTPAVPTPAATTAEPATPAASQAPTAVPTPAGTVAPTPAGGPVGGPVPATFVPGSVTFASATEGWAIGTAPCQAPPCTSIVRTTDGGQTWVGIPAPRAPYAASSVQTADPTAVHGLRFADPLDGWAYGPSLWATHDGGATWQPVVIPGAGQGAMVWALEAANGMVHAALYDGGSAVRIATSPVGTDDWQLSPVRLEVGAGPVPQAQLVLQGAAGWLIEVDRTVVGGARLVNGAWQTWRPPCLDVAGPAVLAASGPADLVAACDEGEWSTPAGEHLYVSRDGGASFSRHPARLSLQGIVGAASPEPGVIVLAGSPPGGGVVFDASFDGGVSWTAVHRDASADAVAELGFTTPTQGVAVLTTPDGTGSMVMTRDAGRTWAPVAFGG